VWSEKHIVVVDTAHIHRLHSNDATGGYSLGNPPYFILPLTHLIMLSLCLPLLLLPSLLAQPTKRSPSQLIYAGRDNLCLSIQGGSAALSSLNAGTSVVSLPCDQANTWDIYPGGSSSIFVSGHVGFVLDAGSNPGNNGGLKVWTSYPGLFQQS
jgi:hypothetical protein